MDEFPRLWESVSTDNNYETQRIRVPGGFIVSIRDTQMETSNILFVACPDGQWQLES